MYSLICSICNTFSVVTTTCIFVIEYTKVGYIEFCWQLENITILHVGFKTSVSLIYMTFNFRKALEKLMWLFFVVMSTTHVLKLIAKRY